MEQFSELNVVVQKYGGSSVADLSGIQRVAARVVQTAQRGYRVVVVVSAMGNTTNELISLARSVSTNPKRRELDLLVSVGERVSMTLLAMAIEEQGWSAQSFTGSQSGIITDELHVSARILEIRPHRIIRALQEGRIVIIAGFQGVSRHGEVTTLGRGGSDATAVAMAAALGAEYCEICSDVSGVYNADPRVVQQAQKLDEISLDGALELSRAGAKVLQAEALAFAQKKNIQLYASATFAASGSGTRLPPGPPPQEVTAVAADDQLLWLVAPSLEHAECVKGAIRRCWSEENTTHLLVDMRNVHDLSVLPAGWQSRGRWASISLLGGAVSRDPEIVWKSVQLMEKHLMKMWWSEGALWTALIPVEEVKDAQRSLYEAFFPEDHHEGQRSKKNT